ncbi:hypothetical protein [Sulfobacillus sp. hq2]|uniref:Uncharacterized protein n=1 Tax=Sulfobacillus thermotolerans TaxID=338644 RepID=A0ABM6RQP8_9FIRM|nr:hypothetical protein [Sulfobacillus sp. hq2]AUW93764.1 hypothetical protein BXT84_07260 [Sulfobacillus thermotolerans]MCY0907469.1 hypothetical protein [Sulfobacillus thermotolerans]POB11556.1 hypothetical protein CO251_04155 [Sulfobacillus sp. hq2]
MNLSSSGWGSSTRGLGALITVMMRYPEINSVQFNPDDRTLNMTFIVRKTLGEDVWQRFQLQLQDVLQTYRWVTGRPLSQISLDRLEWDTATIIELRRDIETVSVEEVGMMIEILHDWFEQDVVMDSHDLLEEELMLQEETIQANLEALTKDAHGHLVALRDEGRVVVFNT